MRTKIKAKYSAVLLIVALLALAVGLLLFGGGSATSASAATAPKYTVVLNGTYTQGTVGGASTATIENQTEISTVVSLGNKRETASLSLESTAVSGTAILQNKDYIGFSGVRFIASQSKYSLTIYNEYNSVVASGKGVLYADLTDGLYKVVMSYSLSSGAGYTQFAMGFNLYCYFTVDSKAPTISGATLSQTGALKNTPFTVTATDSASGVNTLYMKAPNSNTYVSVGTSKTILENNINGLYCFYAKDNVGNTSATYYAYYDTVKPTVNVSNTSGTSIGQYTNVSFRATASDDGIGVSYMQYKTPSASTWSSYNSGTVPNLSLEGNYIFRAVDKAGNVSSEVVVCYDKTKPTGNLYGETNLVSSGTIVNEKYIAFDCSDILSGIKNIYVKLPNSNTYTNYVNGSQLSMSGQYSFYCVDNANNSSAVYSITLDNTAPVLSCNQTTFYETTAYDFTVRATDATSTVTLYYKTPLMTEYAAASNGSYSVVTTDSDGRYYFYAQDAVGNRSETKWVELKVAIPTATIERDNSTNHYRITWDGASTGRLNDNPYTKGTWITQEGEYTFVITSTSNRSNTYHFTIAHGFVAVQTVEPTCTEKGYTVYKCLTCDVSYNSDYVDAHGHSYDEQLIGETCLEGAHYLYTCSVCGHQYKSEYLTTGGHKLDKTIVKATCTDRGYTIYRCTVCDHTYRDDYTVALGHNFSITVLEPTCTEGGHTTYSCKRCDYEYIADYTPANGHNYEETVVEATCTERGYKLHKCSACDDEYKTDETFALGHYYTERTQEVTCTQNGCILHTCTRCGCEYETNVTKALGHKYVSEVTMPATCTDDGNRHYLCARCGDQYDTAIPAFGHNYEITDVKTDGGVTVRTYSCSICGHSYTQDLGDQYEEVSNYVEYLFRQYAPYMWWVFLAVAGVWSIAMGVAIVVANKNEDKQKAKKMLVNYVIGLVVIAVILITCPYLVRGIAALIAG